MIVSGHQPDLLPYSGFWWKLANSDIMDLRIHAQIVKRPGYQRRVMMREQWANVVLAEGQSLFDPISKVCIQNAETRKQLIKAIQARYHHAPYRSRLDDVCDMINEQTSSLLWQFNMGLLVSMRDYLGITTPFSIGIANTVTKTEGVLQWLSVYPSITTYLAGLGAKKYMGDERSEAMFDEVGIKVRWANHDAPTGDSIVSVIADYEDPLEVILRTKDEG